MSRYLIFFQHSNFLYYFKHQSLTVETFTLILIYLLNWQHLQHNIRIFLEIKYKYSHSILCLNLNNKLLTEFNNVYLKNVFPFNNTNVESFPYRINKKQSYTINDQQQCLTILLMMSSRAFNAQEHLPRKLAI